MIAKAHRFRFTHHQPRLGRGACGFDGHRRRVAADRNDDATGGPDTEKVGDVLWCVGYGHQHRLIRVGAE